MKTALFIGRFQPWHRGHYSVLEDLVRSGFQQCIIGIGSAQYQGTKDNPMSYEQRRRCIEKVLQARPLPLTITIVALPDIHDDAAWVAHVNRLVYNAAPKYDLMLSGNELVRQLFTESGILVRDVQPTIAISGTQIRAWIRSNNPRWQDYVEPVIAADVASFIQLAI